MERTCSMVSCFDHTYSVNVSRHLSVYGQRKFSVDGRTASTGHSNIQSKCCDLSRLANIVLNYLAREISLRSQNTPRKRVSPAWTSAYFIYEKENRTSV